MSASPDPKADTSGYSLTTAQILYRVSDFRDRVQEYLWQDYDQAPDFPELKKFLDYWKKTVESPLLSVTITNAGERQKTGHAANGHFYLLN